MSRRPIIAGNWKLNLTSAEGVELAREAARAARDADAAVVLFPTSLAAPSVRRALDGAPVEVGVQNVWYENKGAFTGEISPALALAEGLTWAIVGHSERRRIFGESDELAGRKAAAATAEGMKVILCVGETLEERQAGETLEVVRRQLEAGVLPVKAEPLHESLVIAYEPVWAIGTGRTASPEDAQEVHAFIRGWFRERFGEGEAEATRILYGGSVKAANIAGLMAMPDIDGALVGGASLKADEFCAIIRYKEL